jgi:hypothetical protein
MKKLVIAMTFKGLRKVVPMNSSQQGRQQQILYFLAEYVTSHSGHGISKIK